MYIWLRMYICIYIYTYPIPPAPPSNISPASHAAEARVLRKKTNSLTLERSCPRPTPCHGTCFSAWCFNKQNLWISASDPLNLSMLLSPQQSFDGVCLPGQWPRWMSQWNALMMSSINQGQTPPTSWWSTSLTLRCKCDWYERKKRHRTTGQADKQGMYTAS